MKSKQLAFIYNGQGSQHQDMGRDFYQTYPIYKEIIDLVIIHEKPYFSWLDEASLASTKFMQPMIYTFNYALTSLLLGEGISPSFTGGQSLGEYNALNLANVFDFNEGLSLTSKRGEAMEKAALNPSKMMAALGDQKAILKASLPEGIYISNINSDTQVVLGGSEEGFKKLSEFNPPYIKRLIPLNTEAAFHTPFMNEACALFEKTLEDISFNTPNLNLYQNVTGLKSEDITKKSLIDHINHPVQFQKMIQSMVLDGVTSIVEIGPKSLLKKLIKSIDNQLEVMSVYDVTSFQELIKNVKGESHG